MAKKVLETTFKADGDLLDYMKRTGAGADTLKAKMAELKVAAAKKSGGGDDDEGGGGGLASIRKQLGARSALGQLGSIAVGGAAVAGVTYLTTALGGAADKARELKEQFDAGKIGAGGLTAGIVESLPVLGSMVTAFSKVGDLLASFPALADSWAGKMLGLSDRRYAEQVRQEEVGRKALLDYQADALERQKKALVDIAAMTRRANQEKAGADLDGYDKERFERQAQNADKLADLQAKRQAALDEAEKDRKARAADIDGQDIGTGLKVEMRARLQKAAHDEQARINRAFDQQDRAQREAAAAEADAGNRRHLESMARVYAGYARQINGDNAAANVERLRTLGRTLDAELALVRQNQQQKKQAIDEALVEQLKQAGNPLERQTLEQDADAAKAAVDRAAAMDRQNAVYKELRDSSVQVLQAQAAAGDQAAEAELRRVQAAREYEAELLKIQAVKTAEGATDAQRAQADADLRALAATRAAGVANGLRTVELDIARQRAESGDFQAAADVRRLEQAEKDRQVEADIAALRKDGTPQQQLQADRDLAALRSAQAAAVAKQLRDEHEAMLQQRSEYGATAAERLAATKELAAEQIKQQFAERQAQTQAILDSRSATAEQKQQAVADLQEFAELAGREYAKKVYGQPKPVLHEFKPEDRGLLLTGISAAARNHDPTGDVVRNTAEGNKLTAELLAAMKDTAAAVKAGRPTVNVPAAPAPNVTVRAAPAAPPTPPRTVVPPRVTVPRPPAGDVPPTRRSVPIGASGGVGRGEYMAVLREIAGTLRQLIRHPTPHAGQPVESVFGSARY